jgi:hypothetical protein
MNTGTCTQDEPCDCPDCALSIQCTDPGTCVNDGVCAILLEGCRCDDCKDLPECAPWVDGGVEGGAEGGVEGGLDAGPDAADAGG